MAQPEPTPHGNPPHPWPWRILQYRILLATFGTALVFGLSSIPFRTTSPLWRMDKYFHILEYLFVGLAYLNFFTHGFVRLTRSKILWYLLLVAAVAAADEVHQKFVPGRSSNLKDFLASVAGGVLALLVAAWLHRKLRPQPLTRPPGEPELGP